MSSKIVLGLLQLQYFRYNRIYRHQFSLAADLLKKLVSSHSSILLGELVAILLTIDYVTEEINNSDFSDIHIFSDSQSAIGILKLAWQPSQHKHTVAEIKQKIQSLEYKNIMVNISWTPGHANIKGNEEADRLAKEASCEAATMKSDTDVVTMADIKQAAVRLGLSQWQRHWEASEHREILVQL